MSCPIAFIGVPGLPELLIVAAIILLLFGNRLPGVMRSLGRGIVEFKKGVKGIEDEVEDIGKIDATEKKDTDKE
jgi:sec-independent protein translocase protein TatA